jgi:hypothetical protein
MFLNAGPLPHVICSPPIGSGGHDEAVEHGDEEETDRLLSGSTRVQVALRRRGYWTNSSSSPDFTCKHAMRLLQGDGGGRAARRVRRRTFENAERNALALRWEASDGVSGKRLKALLPVLVEAMECHGHLTLAPEIRGKLLR